MAELISGLVPTPAGVIVGGLLTYLITTRLERRREVENKRALAKALKAELEATWGKYLNTFGEWINEHQDKIKAGNLTELHSGIFISEDYLAIFHSSTGKLGLFPKEVIE